MAPPVMGKRCNFAGCGTRVRLQVGGFAVYLASKDAYEDSFLPNGSFAGTPEEAFDCACGLYLNDPSAWRS